MHELVSDQHQSVELGGGSNSPISEHNQSQRSIFQGTGYFLPVNTYSLPVNFHNGYHYHQHLSPANDEKRLDPAFVYGLEAIAAANTNCTKQMTQNTADGSVREGEIVLQSQPQRRRRRDISEDGFDTSSDEGDNSRDDKTNAPSSGSVRQEKRTHTQAFKYKIRPRVISIKNVDFTVTVSHIKQIIAVLLIGKDLAEDDSRINALIVSIERVPPLTQRESNMKAENALKGCSQTRHESDRDESKRKESVRFYENDRCQRNKMVVYEPLLSDISSDDNVEKTPEQIERETEAFHAPPNIPLPTLGDEEIKVTFLHSKAAATVQQSMDGGWINGRRVKVSLVE